jgi:hypothetical protein
MRDDLKNEPQYSLERYLGEKKVERKRFRTHYMHQAVHECFR